MARCQHPCDSYVAPSEIEERTREEGRAARLEYSRPGTVGGRIFGALDTIDNLAPEQFPGALVELSALQARLASRMVANAEAPGRDEGPDQLLDAAEVASRLGISKDAVYRKKKDWPFVIRIGRHVRFSERGLQRWLSRRARTR